MSYIHLKRIKKMVMNWVPERIENIFYIFFSYSIAFHENERKKNVYLNQQFFFIYFTCRCIGMRNSLNKFNNICVCGLRENLMFIFIHSFFFFLLSFLLCVWILSSICISSFFFIRKKNWQFFYQLEFWIIHTQ